MIEKIAAKIARLGASPQEVPQNDENGNDAENDDEAIRRERRPRVCHVTCRQGHHRGNQITKSGHRVHYCLLMPHEPFDHHFYAEAWLVTSRLSASQFPRRKS